MNRETWLNQLAALMAPRFDELGHPLPKFRVSIGWPSGGKDAPVTGECWHDSVSADGHFEIFLNPGRADSLQVAATLAHELTHCAVGFAAGHKGDFAKVVGALGFARPFTHASKETPEQLAAWLQPMIDQLGPLPHGAITYQRAGEIKVARKAGSGVMPDKPQGDGEAPPINNRPPKQSTRLLKAVCGADDLRGVDGKCHYTVRITRKWVDALGAPHCPAHGAMTVEGMDDSEGGEG